MILKIYKNLGETPLEALEKFRKENNIDPNISLTYAGRLDPMAEGLLVVLSGEDVHKKEEILLLDKEYELDILWNIKTDTHDLLGIPSLEIKDVNGVDEEYKKWIGSFEQEYPLYSSKTVNGKSLWEWSREGKISEIEIPKKQVEIKSIERLEDYSISSKELLRETRRRIDLIKGDFRQNQILEKWEEILENKDYLFKVSRFKVLCSSGTYMRALAHNMAKNLGVFGLAYRIKRNKVGDFILH